MDEPDQNGNEWLLQQVRLSERLRATVFPLRSITSQLDEILADDPELAPEVEVALGHLNEAAEGIVRAFAFLSARIDVRAGA